MRRLLIVGLTAGLLLVPGAAASATSTPSMSEVVSELRADRVFVDASAAVGLDERSAEDAVSLSRVRLYVAALPAAVGDAARAADRIGRSLGDSQAVVLVLTDRPSAYAATSSALRSRGISGVDALRAAPVAGAGDADRLVRDVVAQLDAQSAEAQVASRDADRTRSVALVAVLVLGAAALLLSALRRGRARRRRGREDAQLAVAAHHDARADVHALHARLGHDVETLAPGEDPVARQALADAQERWTTTGSLLAQGDAPGALEAARRAAEEGLAATRTARRRLGLDETAGATR